MIQIAGLTKFYEQGEVAIPALNGIDLIIEKGQFIVILGPSGSGKTTLLNLVGGIDYKTEGSIIVNNQEITCLREKELTEYRKREIGFIFQFYNLIPTLTASENVEIAARLKFSQNARNKALAMLAEVGLAEKAHKFPSQLSGGEQQRVAIARALVKEPDLILADEPTGNLDSVTSDKILSVMVKACKERSTTFLIVTHNRSISKLADKIIYLKDGKIFGTSDSE
ncbi:MAG: ABC transporter ATP-binding protein [Candidatus Heimdallarchaeota archaeon]|nr:ABC transporter ATP-binding protein [Candidatus Heimdallarchaeota archaeon]